MLETPNLSAGEMQAFELISSHDGILQSDLWKLLAVTSREGSRLATSLAEKGLIDRTMTTQNGQRTYLLTPTAPSTPETRTERPLGSVPTERRGDTSEAEQLTLDEERALSLIRTRRDIHQSDLWKELQVSSRTGSRIASRLEETGLIRREETTYNSQRTFVLVPLKKDLDFSLLMAGNLFSPMIGRDSDVDPIHSDEFTEWIFQLVQTRQ